MSEQNLPRVTYFNIDADLSGIHALFDCELPGFIAQLPLAAVGEGQPYDVFAPHDRRLKLGQMVATPPAVIDASVCTARAAQPNWDGVGFATRIALLRQAAAQIRDHRFQIGMGLMLEVGKSRTEAMGEVEEAIDLIETYCAQAESTAGFMVPMKAVGAETGIDLLRPYGVFAVIAPFNFPLALAVSMVSAALLMGNAVVFKPTEMAIFSAAAMRQIFAHLPPGVFQMITGGAAVGAALTDAAIDGVAFTGSRAVGMQLVRKMAAGDYMRPVIAELGGKNAAFVTASADVAMAAKAVARAAFGLSGQKCSACAKVYVARAVADDFIDQLKNFTASLKMGDPTDPQNFLGSVINAATGARYAEALRDVPADKIIVGGAALTGGLFDHGTYLPPTVVVGLDPDHVINQQELFAPLVSVQVFDDLAAAIADANRTLYGLTAGLYTNDAAEQALFLARHEAGVMYVNRPSAATTGAWPGYQGFCGWKGSGVSGKGGLGPHYPLQFAREQSRTIY